MSYYYRHTQDFHLEFRELISEIFENNIEKFIDFYPDHNILGETEPQNEEEIMKLLEKYKKKMKEPKFYAGDLEIATTSFF